ncbi:BrnA antitoxin family protein [Phyllobacterium sp. YR531]|uniref:BrnA antitoxin family protein n=1 Tax=Phyllobacterium sp. YR531 TaxID=1144343 RepID=UPI00026F6D2F|nr:BrnA antitoxin family protein [Phyllobacterium sp. YR531]EJM98819.1 hypothetical protein PMI41_04581 [Phyllobacterium sp. YR531]
MSKKSTTAKYSLSEIARTSDKEGQAEYDCAPEAESLGEDFWESARVILPKGKTSVHLRLDTDIIDWFKAHGKGHLTRMNAVLRAYVEAHRKSK